MTATAVLKFGGDVVADRQRLGAVLEVVAARVREGGRFVICHGGGPQISALTQRLGMRPNKVGGRRVTDDSDLVAAVIAHWSRHEADEATADALERRLERLFPFARDHVVARDRSVGMDAWCALPTYQVSKSSEHPLGGRRPHTGFSNLFRAGRDLAPRLGLAGELAAARSVAGVSLKATGKKAGVA